MKNLVLLLFIVFQACAAQAQAHSPKIIAHRGGQTNFPENTIHAFESALKAGCDGLELDVQLTKDGEVVLYHPANLSKLTDGSGSVSEKTLAEIKQLNAGYNFKEQRSGQFIFRDKGLTIPTLSEALDKFPSTEIIVDLKSLPAKPLVDAVVRVVDAKKAWGHLTFYSTNAEHMDYLRQIRPQARMFEDRSVTRKRLLTLRNSGTCCCKDAKPYAGFELSRLMVVEETFALGKDTNEIQFDLWDEGAMRCTRNAAQPAKKVVLFGVNSPSTYAAAQALGAYGVLTDNPLAILAGLG